MFYSITGLNAPKTVTICERYLRAGPRPYTTNCKNCVYIAWNFNSCDMGPKATWCLTARDLPSNAKWPEPTPSQTRSLPILFIRLTEKLSLGSSKPICQCPLPLHVTDLLFIFKRYDCSFQRSFNMFLELLYCVGYMVWLVITVMALSPVIILVSTRLYYI